MAYNVHMYLPNNIRSSAIFKSGTKDIHVCTGCLNRHEIRRCDGTTKHYWEYCQVHDPAYRAGHYDNDTQETLADIRQGIYHSMIKKPPPVTPSKPAPARNSRWFNGSRYGNPTRSWQNRDELPDPTRASYAPPKKIEPLWPSVITQYKHADGCIHAENVEYKVLQDSTLILHARGGRDAEAKAVLQQERTDLLARCSQNYWRLERDGRPAFERTVTEGGIRVYFKRCNGQFVDTDGCPLPVDITNYDVNTTIVPLPEQLQVAVSYLNLLDTEDEPLPKRFPALIPEEDNLPTSSKSSPTKELDDLPPDLNILPSWKESWSLYSTDIPDDIVAAQRLEVQAILASWDKQATSPPLIPDIPSYDSAPTTISASTSTSTSSFTSTKPFSTTTEQQPGPKVSLTVLMGREQMVHTGAVHQDTLTIYMHHRNGQVSAAEKADMADWRRSLYVSGHLVDDPLLETR